MPNYEWEDCKVGISGPGSVEYGKSLQRKMDKIYGEALGEELKVVDTMEERLTAMINDRTHVAVSKDQEERIVGLEELVMVQKEAQ